MSAVGGEPLGLHFVGAADATFLVKANDADAHSVAAFLDDVACHTDVFV